MTLSLQDSYNTVKEKEPNIKLEKHIVISTSASLVFYLYSRSLAGTIACFLTGIFIDLDHILDYLLYSRFKFHGLGEFFRACDEMRFSRFYLVLHSYELIPVIFLVGYQASWNSLWLGPTIGFLLHLIADEFSNKKKHRCNRFFYFFTYRLSKRFRKELLISKGGRRITE